MTYLARTYTPANGTTVDFAIPFDYRDAADIHVYLMPAGLDISSAVEVEETVDWSLASSTIARFVSPPPPGQVVVIRRITPSASVPQVPSGTISSATLNGIHNQLLFCLQEAQDNVTDQQTGLSRTVRVPSSVASIASLSSPTTRAGKSLGFDTNGDPIPVPTDSAQIAASVALSGANATQAGVYAGQAHADQLVVTGSIALLPHRTTKATATTRASTATLAADPDVTIALAAGVTVVVEGMISFTTGATPDFKFSFGAPSGATIKMARYAIAPGDTALSAVAVDTALDTSAAVTGGTGSGAVFFSGKVTNGSTAGFLTFKWAQNTSDAGNTSVNEGSFMQVTSVPGVTIFGFPADYVSAIAILGEYDGPNASGGHNFRRPRDSNSSINSHLDTVVTGTKVEAQLFGDGATTYTWTVDGTPTTQVPPTGWTWVTLFSGADGAHRITLKGPYFDIDAFIRVSGLAPACTRPADLPPYYILALHTSEIAQEGIRSENTSGGTVNAQRIWLGGSGFGLKFRAAPTAAGGIKVWGYEGTGVTPATGRMLLFQDGGSTPIADVTPPAALGSYTVIDLPATFDGTTHNYELQMVSRMNAVALQALLVSGLSGTAIGVRQLACYYGDSVVEMPDATYGSYTDARVHSAYLVAHANGLSAVRVGHSGQKVSTFLRDGTTELAALPQSPKYVVCEGGANDIIQGVPQATFQADYQTMIANIRTLFPSAIIFCEGIKPASTAWFSASARAAYNLNIAAAVTAIGDLNVIYKSTDGLIDPTTDTIDGIHLNQSGFTKWANQQVTYIV